MNSTISGKRGQAWVVLLVLSVSLVSISLSGCERKKEVKEKQKSADLMTIRTLGLAYLEENNLKEAAAQFQKLIELAPREALGYANLGLVYLRMGKYAEAEEQIKKALAIEPDDPDIRLNLAQIYQLQHREDEAVALLEETIQVHPDHAKSLYKLAEIYSRSRNREHWLRAQKDLEKLVGILPANLPARLDLIEVLLRNRRVDEAVAQMEAIRKQMPELPKESTAFFEKSLSLMRAGKADEALTVVRIFHHFMKLTPVYQSGLADLQGPGGALMGFPVFNFSQNISLRKGRNPDILGSLRFTDVTADVGLDVVGSEQGKTRSAKESGAIVAIADFDSDGDQDLYVASWIPGKDESTPYLFRNDYGKFVNIAPQAGILHPGKDVAATFADFDNDGYLDIFVTNTVANRLFHNVEEGKFKDIAPAAGLADWPGGSGALFADLDLEGDLDLYMLAAGPNRFFRNNSDGTFTELAQKMGLAGGQARSRDAAIGDFDDDGDLDLFVANEDASNILFTNLRQGHFQDITAQSGLRSRGGTGAVAVGDVDNDGFLDIFVTGLRNGEYALLHNRGNGVFEKDTRSPAMYRALKNVVGLDARFFDFDNDGFLDLLVVGKAVGRGKSARGVRLFHNDGSGRFKDTSSLLPQGLVSGFRAAVADFNEDGDMDIYLTGFDGKVRLLRNDGGDLNKYLEVRLVGLRSGSGKNNRYGIGAKLEVRAGDLYQMRVVSEPVTHFGLGQRLKADVIRIVWPNGTPQNLFYPGGEMDLVEQQTLKGSCAFLYTWNGHHYVFVTDILWRSALGMPLGIMGGETAYAFPNSAREYIRIPGRLLREKDGLYSLQITEELWETAYFDQVALVAVDHPDSVDLFIDERFLPPPFPPLKLYPVTRRRLPLSAVDERGNDLLPAIQWKDDVYASDLVPGPYQGITRMHDLILDLGDLSDARRIVLFLNGWIFPTDASINVAISQSDRVKVVPPYLQVPDENGRWRTVVQNLSFPMGKDKMVIADLTDKFLTDDYRVRIRTNMEIYWDYVFFSTDTSDAAVRMTTLPPASANLHFRGFSRVYRKGGRYGPHWFDYEQVSTEPKWRSLQGNYTRYGDVGSLLLESDDKYVILNAGDEMTVEFSATGAPELKPGWRRDFLIYSDGWMKDGDLNTATGWQVEPLPFHGMTKYPYGEDESYPTDEDHQRYLREYNTRRVTTEPFRRLLFREGVSRTAERSVPESRSGDGRTRTRHDAGAVQ